VLSRGDRFILRAYSPAVTMAGGEVLDPLPPRGGARTEAGRRRFDAIDTHTVVDRVAATLIDEAGAAGLMARALGARTGLWGDESRMLVAGLEQQDIVRDLGGIMVSRTVTDGLAREVLADLDEHHRAQPLSEGLPREELRTRRFSRAAEPVFEHVLATLTREGRIVGRDRLALALHRVELSPDEQRARTLIEDAFRSAGLKPASPAEMPAALRLDARLVDRIVKLLTRQKTLVRVDDLLFHADALARLKADVQQLKASGVPARVDVAAFKEKFGVSRKFAIPLLEYLDRERVTKRMGDSRVIL
jgi:selenocysteine-specific elongation factor